MPEKKEDAKKETNNSNKNPKKKKTRKIKKSTVKKISAVIVLIAVLAAVLYFAFRTLRPEQVIATVNDETITRQELEQKYAQLPDQYKLFITKDALLDQIINVKLLLQKAEKESITVSENEVEAEITNLKQQAPTEEAFEDLLKQQNIDLGELKKQLSEQLMINKLLNKTVISKIGITDSRMREYYKKNEDYFKENNISYNKAKEQIRQILLSDLSSNAIEIYINQLKSEAAITKEGAKITKKVETFTKTNDTICKKDGKVIIRLFSTTKNSASKWISKTFDEVAEEYEEGIIAYHWQLDTGDNTLTGVKETGIPKEEVNIFQKYNLDNTVPTYVLGCKYVRIGNAYETLDEEKAEFKRVIDQLLV